MEQHYRHSSFREKLIEHLFIGELLKIAWQQGDCALEVAKPEVDNRGYDLVLERHGVVRHVQLKTTRRGGITASQKIHVALAAKLSGCVVWIEFDERSLALGPFHFLGGLPGTPLPRIADLRVAKHVKGDATGVKKERPDIRVARRSMFTTATTLEELITLLFGGKVNPSAETLARLTGRFRDLVKATLRQYPEAAAADVPTLASPLPDRASPAWWPIAGMYGGFSYWLEEFGGEGCLVVESWSRVVEGSGQRHRITTTETLLVDSGFI